MANSYVNLDGIIRNTLFQMGEVTEHKYDLALSYAYDYVRDAILDGNIFEPKTTLLDVDQNIFVATLPSDFVNWTKVGILVGSEIVMLGVNNDISYPHYFDDCGNVITIPESDDLVIYNSTINPFAPFRTAQMVTQFLNPITGAGINLYGNGSYWNGKGYFKVYRERGQIVLQNVTTEKIVLEYTTNGETPSGATVVPFECQQAIKEYIKYCFTRDNDSAPESKVARKRADYYNESRKARIRINRISLRDFIDSCRKGKTQVDNG